MTGEGLPVAVIGILLGLWLVVATVAIWHGLSLRRQSLKTLRQTGRLARLLETAPAMPVVVKGDGRIEAADRFSRLLGLSKPAANLADIGNEETAGLTAVSMQELDQLVRETQRTGSDFVLPVALKDSERRMLVVGGIADAVIYPNGAALLWFFDSTDSLRELEQRKGESEEARAAFAALAALIEGAPLPMWHRGPDLRLNFVNRAYVKAVGGKDGDQVVAQGVELIEPINGRNAIAFAAQAKELGEELERIVSATIDGERRQIQVFDIPIGDAGVAGLAVDVQDLVEARGEFKRLSDAQRDLLNMISAGVAQFDAERTLTFANVPFQKLFAFREAWIAEQPDFARVFDRIRENGKVPDVRDFPQWRSERENWFRTAEPSEENWLLSDGTHLRVLAQPVPDGGLLLVFEDRTEQAQLASARDTLLRVRTATFDNLSEIVAVFSADGRLNIWNRLFSQLWGLGEELLLTHPRLDELLPIFAKLLKKPSHISQLGELLRDTTASREQGHGTIEFADGRNFQIATVPLPDGNLLFTMLDMTDSLKVEQVLRDRNEALQEADAIKGRFLANMSYEFRTPLTSISGFADLLRTGIAGELNEQAADYVEAIATSAERLSEQINTVLDFSQGEAGAMPIAAKQVDVAQLLQEAVASKQALADENGVTIDLQPPADGLSIMADAKRLSQALGQVLDNAIRYHREGGKVLVFAQAKGDEVEIIVSDDGNGMDAATRAALLEGGQGGGLGLPLAKQLIESHGGTFTLESEPGQGTAIIIALPAG